MTQDRHSTNLNALPPEEMLGYVLADMRSYIGIVGAWAEVLSGEIYQELRPQAIEALQICAKNMQLSYDEIKAYLAEHQRLQTQEHSAERKLSS
jgi:hypothetical protein